MTTTTPAEADIKQGSEDARKAAAQKKTEGNKKFKDGYYRQAIDLYTEAIELNDSEKTFYTNRATARMKLGKYEEAAEDCVKAVEIDTRFSKAYQKGSSSYCHLGKFDEAETFLKKGNKANPYDLNIRGEMQKVKDIRKRQEEAKNAVESGNFDKAMLIFPGIDKVVTHDLETGMLKIRALLGVKRYELALKEASSWYAVCKTDVNLIYLRGLALYLAGNSAMAIRHFQMVLKSAPDFKEAQDMYRKIKKMDRAKAAGTDEFKNGNYAEAIARWSEALEVDTDNRTFNTAVLSNRASAHMKLKQYDKAVKDLDKVLEVQTDNKKALLRRATCHTSLGNHDGAVRDLDMVSKMDPRNREIRQRLHKARVAQKRASRKDYYKILGVSQDVSDRELKKAYRKAALRWHPDKNAGSEEEKKTAEEKFKDVNEAYEVLSDENKRARYDNGEDLEGVGGMGGMGGMDPNMMFNMFFGGGRHRGGPPGGFEFHFG
eukprot:CAMPEP_0184491986 /NCGR_PEP_ID=MMETSP0113_2-20130426/21945_1 /TAXON_ID=91329 /ORGANISM="Norrisiella sphaerica, Strain BC52" /LENGTH=487 /DNA_ID=CAMNT_0026876577 /DNA_START=330 /DNA_END=1793 /DNA_ORIENTATION=-